jgi:DNA-binding response OmpR family regulator
VGEPERTAISAKVLVSSKEPEIGDLLKLILSRFGVTVRVEPLGYESGLARIESIVATGEKELPDLIVLDSEHLSDEQFYRVRASPMLRETPILFIDCKPHNLVDKQAKRLGVNGYVMMPFGPQEILTAVQAVLRGETYYPPLPETSPSDILQQRIREVLSEDLLKILRCPYCATDKTHGVSEDAGQLELIQDCWLVCREPGCSRKYPVRDGMPVMLIEEGDKWINVAENDLPIPPPPE